MKSPLVKRNEAYDRYVVRSKRSVSQQLAILKNRPGSSRKERERLAK